MTPDMLAGCGSRQRDSGDSLPQEGAGLAHFSYWITLGYSLSSDLRYAGLICQTRGCAHLLSWEAPVASSGVLGTIAVFT